MTHVYTPGFDGYCDVCQELRPWCDGRREQPDGAGLLDQVEAFLRRFVAFPSEHAAVAVTLWAAHTHELDCFDSTPRLALLSPEPGSGKTRTLEVLELLTPRPMHALNVSAAALFRRIGGEHRPTLLFDEVDTVFTSKGRDDANEDVRGVLNAGHRHGATIPRCYGPNHDVRDFPVFAACALAGLGDLPNTLMSRSIVVRMRRRAPYEHVEPFRHRVHAPEGDKLRERLADWVSAVTGDLDGAWPAMPEGVADRDADVWEALLAVADAAGGQWPHTARRACSALVAAASTRKASLRVRLLADLHEVFGDAHALPTAFILDALANLDEAPWATLNDKGLDARGLARMLGEFQTADGEPIGSRKIWHDGRSLQGYLRDDLRDAWARYLTPSTREPEGPEGAEDRTSSQRNAFHPPSGTADCDPGSAFAESPSLAGSLACESDIGSTSGSAFAESTPEDGREPEGDTPPATCELPFLPDLPAAADTQGGPARWRIKNAPADAVRVDRRTRWGNPYKVEDHGRDEAVRLHREQLLADTLPPVNGYAPVTAADVRRELAGRDLACWCGPDEACHADTLLAVADATSLDDEGDTP